MNVKIITRTFDDDSRASLEVEVDGKVELSFCDGEPEDNSLYRNFNDCYKIGDLIRKVWNAACGDTNSIGLTIEEVDGGKE